MAKTRNVFRWNKKDELYPSLEIALYEATQKGYSVVELSRIMGNSKCKNLYAIMRDAGIIAKLPRRRWPAVKLLAALEKCQISFVQWANSHDLDGASVATVLDTVVDYSNPLSVAAHKALNQDFCFLSSKMYGLPVDPDRVSAPSSDSTLTNYTVIIKPDWEADGYRAYIPELEECSSFGATRDQAYFGLKSRYVIFHSIRKLKVLPCKPSGE